MSVTFFCLFVCVFPYIMYKVQYNRNQSSLQHRCSPHNFTEYRRFDSVQTILPPTLCYRHLKHKQKDRRKWPTSKTQRLNENGINIRNVTDKSSSWQWTIITILYLTNLPYMYFTIKMTWGVDISDPITDIVCNYILIRIVNGSRL
jgi:hypothetical protein